jgi:hypothetical protein
LKNVLRIGFPEINDLFDFFILKKFSVSVKEVKRLVDFGASIEIVLLD